MKKTAFIAALSFFAGILFFALTFGYIQRHPGKAPLLSPAIAEAETLAVPSVDFVPLVKKVKPAVVKVVAQTIVERRRGFFGDDFFDRFFNQPPRPERREGLGSGFLISRDGYILTNNHVVSNAVKITVIDIDKKEHTARTIGTDPKTDLALLKIEGNSFPFIRLGDSNAVEVGEWVLAIGNPLGMDLSVTSGIISAKGRQLYLAEYEDFLQTDAAINMGNSGGPLLNLRGEAIGINSAILAPNMGNIGIGFAIPANMAAKVVDDLKQRGRVIRGWFGISIDEISDAKAKEYDLPEPGILVLQVEDNSPAKKAGLQPMDLIIEFDGKRVTGATDLQMRIANTPIDQAVEVTLIRNNKKMKIKVIVTEAPDSVRIMPEEGRSFDLGMVLLKNTPTLAREHNLRTDAGLLVMNVEREGIAQRNGIEVKDVILAVNRTELTSVDQFRSIMAGRGPGQSVYLFLNRAGRELVVRFRIPE